MHGFEWMHVHGRYIDMHICMVSNLTCIATVICICVCLCVLTQVDIQTHTLMHA